MQSRLLFKQFGCEARLLFTHFIITHILAMPHCASNVLQQSSSIMDAKQDFFQTFVVQSLSKLKTFVQNFQMQSKMSNMLVAIAIAKFKHIGCIIAQRKTFVQTFWVHGNTFVQTIWVHAKQDFFWGVFKARLLFKHFKFG